MKNIAIEVINQRKKKTKGIFYIEGKITINDFWETFYISLDWWSQADYERQWKEGLERIRTHDKSCLVTEVQNPNKMRCVDWWLLYKEGNKIFIRNYVLFEEYYDEVIGDKPFTVENCYDFIWPKEPTLLENGEEMSEWVVELDNKEN